MSIIAISDPSGDHLHLNLYKVNLYRKIGSLRAKLENR